MRIASIDIGSNSILLLIAAKTPQGTWRRVEEYTDIARISAGLDTHGTLQPAAIERALAVLRRFVAHARAQSVETILLTGTAPFRRAANGRDIAEHFAETLKVPLMIASGDEEAKLTLRATLDSFPQFDAMRVLDIGGASTELIEHSAQHTQTTSIDLGVVRLLERFVHHDPPHPEELHQLQEYVRAQLERSWPVPDQKLPIVGVGGTITSLAALDLGLTQWDADVVQGHQLRAKDIGILAERLWPMSTQERCDTLHVDPRRADVIGVGASFLYAICQHLRADEMIVSDRGVRWGRIYAWDKEQHVR